MRLKKLFFPIKAITLVWRFLVLLAWTAYLEGNRGDLDFKQTYSVEKANKTFPGVMPP